MRRRELRTDIFQIFLSAVAIVMAVFLFIDPEKWKLFFPIIFGIGAAVCLIRVITGLSGNRNRRKKSSTLIVFGALGVLLVLMCLLTIKVLF